jgi:hypothetical protein
MGFKTAISLLRNPKTAGVVKDVITKGKDVITKGKEIITKIKPSLGLTKKKEYLAKTAYARAASTSYAREMKKPEHLTKAVGKKNQ